MNENSPTCDSATPTGSATVRGTRKTAMTRNAASGLPTMTTASAPVSPCPATRSNDAGSNSMPTDTKKSTAKASRIGERVGRRAQAELGPPDDKSSEEGAERHRHAEDFGRSDGDTECDHQHGQREQLAGSCGCDPIQQPRNDPHADESRQCDERG